VVLLNLSHNLLPVTMPYSLNCALIGQDIAFTVNINETRTVDNLKDMIKKKAEITGPAHTLKLYQVNLAVSGTYQEVMSTISQSATCADVIQALSQSTTLAQVLRAIPQPQNMVEGTNKELEYPFCKLSTLSFSTPADGDYIHILVELPPGQSNDSIDP
jgi:hypothetical protein